MLRGPTRLAGDLTAHDASMVLLCFHAISTTLSRDSPDGIFTGLALGIQWVSHGLIAVHPMVIYLSVSEALQVISRLLPQFH